MQKIRFSIHALERMAERNITIAKVEEILLCGAMYSNSNGLHRVKYSEYTKRSRIDYNLIYSKSSSSVVTIWVDQRPYKYRDPDDDTPRESSRRFRKRKRAAREKEQLIYCREEMKNYICSHAA